jgi:hypothetical protein
MIVMSVPRPLPSPVSPQTPPELDHAAQLLEEQLGRCHAAILGFFAMAAADDNYDNQAEPLKLASRLMHASAAAASALQRLRGAPTRHEVVVNHAEGGPAEGGRVQRAGRGTPPQIAKTNGVRS